MPLRACSPYSNNTERQVPPLLTSRDDPESAYTRNSEKLLTQYEHVRHVLSLSVHPEDPSEDTEVTGIEPHVNPKHLHQMSVSVISIFSDHGEAFYLQQM